MDIKITDRIGYISKRIGDDGKPVDFVLKIAKIKRINIGKTKTTVKTDLFSRNIDVEEITSTEQMKEDCKSGLILTSEPFIIDNELENHLTVVVKDWNENGAKGIFD